MKCSDIHIRDPYVLVHEGNYYMYGSRAQNFAKKVGGFDVYVSTDLVNWTEPVECFNSIAYDLNDGANWAPEVHRYKDHFYMLATFTQKDGLRGTYILKADSPMGPFVPHSEGAVTPKGWQCLDGTLYLDKKGKPYMVFCHEHVQILDGTVCYMPLTDDLKCAAGEAVTLFAASSVPWVEAYKGGDHYVTDGPFLHRMQNGELLMIWSSFIQNRYAQFVVKFDGGEIGMDFHHLPPIFRDDGGHGMIFAGEGQQYLTLHYPNTKGFERPRFFPIYETDNSIVIKENL